MTFGHNRHIPGHRVVDRDKAGHQLIIFVDDGKVFLMLPHGINQDLIGNFKKFFIKVTGHDHRVLNQIVDNIHQFIIRQNTAVQLPSDIGDIVFQLAAPLLHVGHNVRRTERVQVVLGRFQFYFGRRHKAVPVGVAVAF